MNWLLNRLGWFKATKLSQARAMAADWEKRSAELLARTKYNLELMQQMQDELKDIAKEVQVDGAEMERLQARHEVALSALRSELEVAEGTIEALVRSNTLILKRMDADLAVQTRREVAFVDRGTEE